MKKLLRNLVIILVGLAVIDQSAGVLLDYLRIHAPDGRYYKAAYSLERCNEPIVIIGSSRGESNFAPYIFADSLQRPVWNASRGGQGLPYFRAIQEGLLARYRPEIVILNIEADMLQKAPLYPPAGFLRPFYRSHPEIREVLNHISPSESLVMNSRLVAYNSSYYYMLRPYLVEGLDGINIDQGWKPRSGVIAKEWQRKLERFRFNEPLNEDAVREFEKLSQAFLDAGTKVYVVVSPNYAEVTEASTTLDYLREFSSRTGSPVLEYVNKLALSATPEYFVDYQHLNREGSMVFSQLVAGDMKKLEN